MKVNNFDVLKTMGQRSGKIQMVPLSEVLYMQKMSRGAKITIAVDSDVITGLTLGKYVGGLILADKAEFDAIAEELGHVALAELKIGQAQQADQPEESGEF